MQSRLKSQFLFWLAIPVIIGTMAGISSAIFLRTLEFATFVREMEPWLLYGLPLAGLLIVYMYKNHGRGSEVGFMLVTDEIHNPKKIIPARMAPFIFIGTIMTHLFGGSAGREGTAVQMSTALADQVHLFSPFGLSYNSERRKIILMMGMSAGLAAVFGTPLAGWIFGLEVFRLGKIRSRAVLPCLIAAVVAHLVCLFCGAQHTVYRIDFVPDFHWLGLGSALVAGMCFGLCARIFSLLVHATKDLFKQRIRNAYLRPFIGGIMIILLTHLLGTHRYLGLGIPVIVESLQQLVPPVDFLFKGLFTIITLGSGFVGGEVTPLFYIGSTLGNALSPWLSLPFSLLAGMGLVGVFAGAARTPLACCFMAYELFGPAGLIYMIIACYASALVSGPKGIYHFHLKESHEVRN